MANVLEEFFRSLHLSIDPEILRLYTNSWKERSYPRKFLITEEGETQRHLFFVVEGIQKSYFLRDGKEHVMAFTHPPSFSGIPESFINQSPSKYFLESITATKLLEIPYKRHMELLHVHRPIETMVRVATEKVLFGLIDRHADLMADDIETRFRKFMQRSPHLLSKVPHKDLASYLRIDPTNFSKLLGRIRI